MPLYLIDANLPYYFSLWQGPEYTHVRDLDDRWTDREIWEYAERENLTILTKDADFSALVLLSSPPPRVIHIRLGNMTIRELHRAISERWEDIRLLSCQCKLVQVFADRIEGIE